MVSRLRNMTSVYLTGEKEILCLYRIGSRVANHKYIGSAGGHFEEKELNDPKACALREMEEELGLLPSEVEDLHLRYITFRLKDGEIRQNYYFFGKLAVSRPLKSTEGELRWVPFEEIPNLRMPMSAKHMILHYLESGRWDRRLYAGITGPMGTEFIPMEDFED